MNDAYKKSGVDVEKGYEAVARMKKHIAKTGREEVLGDIGAFGGLFDLSSFQYDNPVLVSGTDGVGTKLKLAFQMDRHDTIGEDLVAMCVNDIVAQGASPLFFLDYIGCSENDPAVIEQIVSGVASGCVKAGAALIGGETAEMPDMYARGEYDLAGFAVGIADKSELITGTMAKEGDQVIGITSSGLHANGYSLVRKIISDLDMNEIYPGFDQPLGEVLLTPTTIYATVMQQLQAACTIKGITHITGGGFTENFPRMLPDGLGVSIFSGAWEAPEIFSFLQQKGDLTWEEMSGIFNMGIGMAVIVPEADTEKALDVIKEAGEQGALIGTVKQGTGVDFR